MFHMEIQLREMEKPKHIHSNLFLHYKAKWKAIFTEDERKLSIDDIQSISQCYLFVLESFAILYVCQEFHKFHVEIEYRAVFYNHLRE